MNQLVKAVVITTTTTANNNDNKAVIEHELIKLTILAILKI